MPLGRGKHCPKTLSIEFLKEQSEGFVNRLNGEGKEWIVSICARHVFLAQKRQALFGASLTREIDTISSRLKEVWTFPCSGAFAPYLERLGVWRV